MKKNKSIRWTYILFAIVGSIFAIIGSLLVVKTITFKFNAEEVMALITDIDSYDEVVKVQYEYEGFAFDVTLDTYSSGMREGEWIPVYVNRDDPTEVVEPGTYLGMGIGFAGLGLIAVLVSVIPLLRGRNAKKRLEKLRISGVRLRATIDEITLNERIAVNEQHPYIILCSYVDEMSGAKFQFKSNNIWEDVESLCDVGSPIDVWVKADDYLDYVIDVESLIDYSIKNNEW